MPKEHQIKTMNDIFKIVNSENVERFLSDFNASLFQIVAIKELCTKKEQKDLEYDVYKWTDDHIKKVTLKLNVKQIIDFQKDELFLESAELVVIHQSGSTSVLQRFLKLGYNRAFKLLNELEMFGIVGKDENSKPRKVLFKNVKDLQIYLNDL